MKYMAIYSCSWLFYYFASYYLMFYTALFGRNFQVNLINKVNDNHDLSNYV
jgi:hypothetical protein